MRAIQWFTAGAASVVVLTGCGSGPAAGPVGVGHTGYRLFGVDTQTSHASIGVIDSATGQLERNLPLGTPSSDWSRLYSVSYGASRTSLAAIDTRNGNVTSRISFPGGFELPTLDSTGVTGGLSPNGQWLVARSAGQANVTDFMLISTTFTERPRRISLSGDFAFDAISNDGQRLYLIESLAAIQPGHYRVRLYDLNAGELDPRVVIDKREIATGSMTGTRLSSLVAPDGRWQYSLYVSQTKGAFIHALNLESPFAWCIDLPAGGDQSEQMMWSLAINRSGTALFATNPTLGKVARIDISADGPSDEVSQTGSFTPARPTASSGIFKEASAKGVQMGSAAVTPDGQTLLATADAGTVAIQVQGLGLERSFLTDAAIESVVMSDDGAALFASSWNGPSLFELSPTSGAQIKSLTTDVAWTLVHAER